MHDCVLSKSFPLNTMSDIYLRKSPVQQTNSGKYIVLIIWKCPLESTRKWRQWIPTLPRQNIQKQLTRKSRLWNVYPLFNFIWLNT